MDISNRKYGILTYHNMPNFGAVSQTYALCRAMRSLGADCEVIDYRSESMFRRERTPHSSRGSFRTLAVRLLAWPEMERKIRNCDAFIQPMCSRVSYDNNRISEANQVYDAFLSGSDVIWDFVINSGDTAFLLDFSEPQKLRFSYAASLRHDWTDVEKSTAKRLLSRYDKLSVRERDVAEFLRSDMGLSCQWNADSTMLLTPDEWEKLTVPVKERKKYVLVYFPNAALVDAAKQYARERNLETIALTWKWSNLRSRKLWLDNVEEWLSYLRHAEAVFTNSYHGLLFSLYFQKKAWTMRTDRRISSLCGKLGMAHCIFEQDGKFLSDTDTVEVQEKLSAFRNDSLRYLRELTRFRR